MLFQNSPLTGSYWFKLSPYWPKKTGVPRRMVQIAAASNHQKPPSAATIFTSPATSTGGQNRDEIERAMPFPLVLGWLPRSLCIVFSVSVFTWTRLMRSSFPTQPEVAL